MNGRKVGDLLFKAPSLRWRIVAVLLAASLLPLVIAGFGSWVVFGRLLEHKAREQMRTVVTSHAAAIDSYLAERVNLLQLTAGCNSISHLTDNALQDLLAELNEASDGGFVDLGVIDAKGDHRAYVGPYDLHDRNYVEAEWFREVMLKGSYVSDVFLGYRQVPHCVVAVKEQNGHEGWVLRATVNSAQFDDIVDRGDAGGTCDAYVLNSAGLYQTTPRVGAVLDTATAGPLTPHRGVRERRILEEGSTRIEATTWINDNQWMLVVRQDLATVRAPVNQAIARGAYVVLAAVLLLVATAFLATWHLTRKIDKANSEREELSRAFMRSAKLASIGELSTGLAHEINNPLAIISAEQTNIADLADELNGAEGAREVIESVDRSRIQIQRCASITKKMLQFGRDRQATLEPTDVAPRLSEISDLLRRRAAVRNIEIDLKLQKGLPHVLIDPVELEQVIVNLLNNSMDALPGGGLIEISARSEGERLHIEVRDNGSGIEPQDIDRVFEPFFTTKPPGKGTGLGLSVCYGVVRSWGGAITVESECGKGTTVHMRLPLPDRKRSRGRRRKPA